METQREGIGPASFGVEELPADWKVAEQGGGVPMDYLSLIDEEDGTR